MELVRSHEFHLYENPEIRKRFEIVARVAPNDISSMKDTTVVGKVVRNTYPSVFTEDTRTNTTVHFRTTPKDAGGIFDRSPCKVEHVSYCAPNVLYWTASRDGQLSLHSHLDNFCRSHCQTVAKVSALLLPYIVQCPLSRYLVEEEDKITLNAPLANDLKKQGNSFKA
ncbi:hypothetical protein FF38_09017 [Lucilia cuprina]|uniref:Uncharacterized protein n=1 Tax=Lucilia cuprina TaxID=7375 RepID=A0A0L0C1Y4_LUCCU|nr:hypothetical protein FF38_09017 [Lucilia cuprina]